MTSYRASNPIGPTLEISPGNWSGANRRTPGIKHRAFGGGVLLMGSLMRPTSPAITEEQDQLPNASAAKVRHVVHSSSKGSAHHARPTECTLTTFDIADRDLTSDGAIVALSVLLGDVLDRIVNSHGREET
jgi:hypothetical protein